MNEFNCEKLYGQTFINSIETKHTQRKYFELWCPQVIITGVFGLFHGSGRNNSIGEGRDEDNKNHKKVYI